jgi:hypothetical protein
MKKIFTILFAVLCSPIFAQTSENEPNNAFTSANGLPKDSLKFGTVNNTSDLYDYFTSSISNDGTVTFYVSATNNGGTNGYLYLYFYDSRQGSGQLLGRYAGNNSNVGVGKSVTDTISFFGRAIDDFYIRIEASTNFSYTIKHTVSDTSVNDLEPNNTFNQSLLISKNEIKKGHIMYTGRGSSDNYDYYKTILPYDGTLKIIVKGKNTSGKSSYLYMYGYDGRGATGQNLARYISNNSNVAAGATINDTIFLYGRAIDTVYFRIEGSGAFSYQLQFDILDSSQNDQEPNNSISQALPLQITGTKVWSY